MYNYNINDYMEYLIEREMDSEMTLEAIFASLQGNSPVTLLPATHKSVSLITEEPFYIGTNFKQISSNLNSKFILVSAPGATGKSAFGKYIAFQRNAIYWNLADDFSIGDGTFQGTLFRALGSKNISSYASNLQNGKAVLIIDAFDEAEVVSGRKNLETFLSEANEFIDGATSPSIIILSRTETAQNIATFFRANSIPYLHYEIDYFPETKAKEFVSRSISKKKDLTPAMQQCIDQYFAHVNLLIKDKDTLVRFLGYAPVLEAIATHISETSNTAKLLSELKETSNEVFLINEIMDSLLQREQEKFVAAFKTSLADDKDKITDWTQIYGKEEQLVRVLNYILFGEVNLSDFPNSVMPEYLSDKYFEKVQVLLSQHPFIQNTFENDGESAECDFSGPAFRDYSLANIIVKDNNVESADLYYQREAATSHFPSPLFWSHYIDLSDGKVSSAHLSYLYDAYKAKLNIGNQSFLDISEDDDGTFATFGISSGKMTVESTTLEVDVSPEGYSFGSISNASISVSSSIAMKNADHVFITDSNIACDSLIISASSLSINAYKPNITSICCKTGMFASRQTPLIINTTASGEIRLDMPNLSEFPKLLRYKHHFDESAPLDIYLFIHFLRKIFSCFRTHKKDMPARDAEKIDFVIVADNPLRKKIFDFLVQNQVIFREAHLYKVNLDKMSKEGISWGALTSSNLTQLQLVYDRFCSWAQ